MEVFEGPPVGPDLVTASRHEVLAAIDSIPPDLPWPTVADRIVPAFERVRPYRSEQPQPFRMLVPPGLSVGFAIDIAPAFINVDAAMVERWRLSAADLLARALDNLDRRMGGVMPGDLHDGSIDGLPVRLLQSSTGCASTYVLLPSSLRRILGPEAQLLIAPMRNLLISLPIDADREVAAWLFGEIAAQDPNCLAPAAIVLTGDHLSVEPLGVAFGSA